MQEIRKTKIICTIGPASDDPVMIENLAQAGMNICRLNFSHEGQDEHAQRILRIREVSDRTGFNLAIMMDTRGPEIRCGEIENGEVEVFKNQEIKILKRPVVGNSERFSIAPTNVFDDVVVGNQILIDDGKISLTIIEK
ncbi:MAG: pyruvate kinase, partial [Erysipelothrix sp.]|nr:pyruvate kinase [Erysipelothrix sp.]